MKPNLETTLKALDLFGKLDPEKKVEIIKPGEVKRNETLDRIIEKYKEGLENLGLYEEHKLKIKIPEGEYFGYHIAKSLALSEIQSKEIVEFSLLLGEYENNKYFEWFTGFYLSALINKSKDKDFKIITNCLTKTINFIGYENAKDIDINRNAGVYVGYRMDGGKITINGNAGYGAGENMKDGEITVKGNVGYWVGRCMKNGEITVNGNAEWWVGDRMEDGEITIYGNAGLGIGFGMKKGIITIKGNAGDSIGAYMEGGEIHLNGNYKRLSDKIYGGNIYHKGKLITYR